MNAVSFTQSFDACVGHGSRVNYKGATIEIFGPNDARGRDMGGYKAHVKLPSGVWKEDGVTYSNEQAAERAAKAFVDANA